MAENLEELKEPKGSVSRIDKESMNIVNEVCKMFPGLKKSAVIKGLIKEGREPFINKAKIFSE